MRAAPWGNTRIDIALGKLASSASHEHFSIPIVEDLTERSEWFVPLLRKQSEPSLTNLGG
jgi:hypothetical protein